MKTMKTLYRHWRKLFWAIGLFIAVLAPYIATDKPLYCRYKGEHLFPAFTAAILVDGIRQPTASLDWNTLPIDHSIGALITYTPATIDPWHKNKPPGQGGHCLGTDRHGRDVLAGLIHGFRFSAFTALISAILCCLLGLGFGSIGPLIASDLLCIRRKHLVAIILGAFIGIFYGLILPLHLPAISRSTAAITARSLITITPPVVLVLLSNRFPFNNWLERPSKVWPNTIISFLVNWLLAMPRLAIVLCFAAVLNPSMLTLILVIGLTGWASIARLARGEFLKQLQAGHMEAARAMGLTVWQISSHHIWPNIREVVLTALALSAAMAIITESSLSFIGIGLPADSISWGSIIAEIRYAPYSWWLVVFPGSVMLLTIYSLLPQADRLSN